MTGHASCCPPLPSDSPMTGPQQQCSAPRQAKHTQTPNNLHIRSSVDCDYDLFRHLSPSPTETGCDENELITVWLPHPLPTSTPPHAPAAGPASQLASTQLRTYTLSNLRHHSLQLPWTPAKPWPCLHGASKGWLAPGPLQCFTCQLHMLQSQHGRQPTVM
jgi:hypothetical protein